MQGDFEENAEHFWEKSAIRQKAMMISLLAFLGLSEEIECQQTILLFSQSENKLAAVCDINNQHIKNSRNERVHVGVMIFRLDGRPFLLTIIPAKWHYVCSLETSRGYKIIYNDGLPPCSYCIH